MQMNVKYTGTSRKKKKIEYGEKVSPFLVTYLNPEYMLLEVQCEISTVSDDLGCHIICWCWSTVFSEVHSQCSHLPGNFRALHASFWWQALWRCWFHFPAGLGTCHTAKGTKSWFNDHGVTVLDLPLNSLDLNPIENCQEEDGRH